MTLENKANVLCYPHINCILFSAVQLIELSSNWISSANSQCVGRMLQGVDVNRNALLKDKSIWGGSPIISLSYRDSQHVYHHLKETEMHPIENYQQIFIHVYSSQNLPHHKRLLRLCLLGDVLLNQDMLTIVIFSLILLWIKWSHLLYS